MRIFVKDENKVRIDSRLTQIKFKAAKYAFEQTCKKFSTQLKE